LRAEITPPKRGKGGNLANWGRGAEDDRERGKGGPDEVGRISFLHSKLFYKEKVYKFQQIYCKMRKKKILNEGNQIHNVISSSGSDFLTSYGSDSGSTGQKVTVPTVPVPQRCF
jgi:hypothetical protein